MSSQSPNYTFYQDLRAAFVFLTLSTVPDENRDDLLFITPPQAILDTGCWCSDSRYPEPHEYPSCPNIHRGPNPSIIASNPSVHKCWHSSSEQRRSRTHRLFCFKPADSADIFIDWLTQPRSVLNGHTGLNEAQRQDILNCLNAYEAQYPPRGQRGHIAPKLDVLSRLLVDLRREGLTREAQIANGSWEVERVRELLEWNKKSFEVCLMNLSWAMGRAAEGRLRQESTRMAAARGRREEEERQREEERERIRMATERRQREEEERQRRRAAAERRWEEEEEEMRRRRVATERRQREEEEMQRHTSRRHTSRRHTSRSRRSRR